MTEGFTPPPCRCTTCGSMSMTYGSHDIGYEYKGRTTTINAMTGYHCPACKESILDDAAGDKYMAVIAAFNRQINDEEAAKADGQPQEEQCQF